MKRWRITLVDKRQFIVFAVDEFAALNRLHTVVRQTNSASLFESVIPDPDEPAVLLVDR